MKKVFFMAAVIAAATVNVLMMSNDKSDLSALQMENIEALAGGEDFNCPNGLQCRYVYDDNDCYNTCDLYPYCAIFRCGENR